MEAHAATLLAGIWATTLESARDSTTLGGPDEELTLEG